MDLRVTHSIRISYGEWLVSLNVLCNSHGAAKRPREGTTKQWNDNKRQCSIMC